MVSNRPRTVLSSPVWEPQGTLGWLDLLLAEPAQKSVLDAQRRSCSLVSTRLPSTLSTG